MPLRVRPVTDIELLLGALKHDTAGTSSTHRGHSKLFAAAGFQRDGKRWWRRP